MRRTIAAITISFFALFSSGANAAAAALDVQIKDVKKQSTLVIKKKVKQAEIGAALAEIFPKLGAFMRSQKIQQLSAPMTFYSKTTGGELEIEAGVVVPDGTKGEGAIEAGELPAGKAAYFVHVGPYEKLPAAYDKVKEILKDKQMKDKGVSWEFYANDPTTVKPDEIKTEIYMPVEEKK